MPAYYNENDPYAAQRLRNLITANLITKGDVDERSVLDVRPDDLKPYIRCHFFAGIAGWDLALQLAAFPADREVWTGSCPCQPFSAAGQGGRFADERHLWPYWFHLIEQRKPATIFGEQVASKAGLDWFDLVFTDLEGAGYAVGVSDLGAASVGAPHIRQRLWFVADAMQPAGEWRTRGFLGAQASLGGARELNGYCADRFADGGEARGRLADAASKQMGLPGQPRPLGDANGNGRQARLIKSGMAREPRQEGYPFERPGALAWADLEWLPCTDGKARPTKPGIFPLVDGIPARVGKLRAAGNAIVPQVAKEFIEAAMEYAP